MSWFGWATKGYCDVSLLDSFTLFGEVAIVAVAAVTIVCVCDWLVRRW